MDLNFDFNLVQSQKLVLTPQFKQALEILTMNSLELFKYTEEQLEANPVLEIYETEKWVYDDFFPDKNEMVEWNDEKSFDKDGKDSDGSNGSLSELLVDRASYSLTLREHLLMQLHTSNLDERQTTIGEYLIDNFDENGYLVLEPADAAKYFNIPVKRILEVLRVIQSFDPPGIGARSLKECLLIQIRQMKCINDDIKCLVENHLDNLAHNKISLVAESTGFSSKKIIEILNFIKTLEPKPGREFYNSDVIKYTVSDIIVKKIRDSFEVFINEDAFPFLEINQYYRRIVDRDASEETRDFIQNRLNRAAWLIKCIEQRKTVLKSIGEYIVGRLPDFFDKGKKYLKPLSLNDAAMRIDAHETVASRILADKYLQCMWGTFEMKSFFCG